MTSVSYKIFEEFLKKNNLTKIQGKWFHSFDWVDNQRIVKATEESSSWGAGDSYMVESEEAENLNTLEFINNIINGK